MIRFVRIQGIVTEQSMVQVLAERSDYREVARQADAPAGSVVSTHRGQVAQIEWGIFDLQGR